MKKSILSILCIFVILNHTACKQNNENNHKENEASVIITSEVNSAAKEITASTPAPSTGASTSPTPEVSCTTPAPTSAMLTELTPTPIPDQFTYFTHTVTSNSGEIYATVYTKAEAMDYNEIIEKVAIQSEDDSFEFSDIIGYYGDMKWSNDDTMLAINYYGRLWGEFIIIDVKAHSLLIKQLYYDNIRQTLEEAGYTFDYEPNESRPDPFISFDEWAKDNKSFKVNYSIIDSEQKTQSGSFEYDLDSGEMSGLEQSLPYEH